MVEALRAALLPSADEKALLNTTPYSADDVDKTLIVNSRYLLLRRKETMKLHVQNTLAKVNSVDNLSEPHLYYDSPLAKNSNRKNVSFSEPLATLVTLVP